MPVSVTKTTITHQDLQSLQKCARQLALKILKVKEKRKTLLRRRKPGLTSYEKGVIGEKAFEGIVSGIIEGKEDYFKETIKEVKRLVRTPQAYDLRGFVEDAKKQILGEMGEELSIHDVLSVGRMTIPAIGVMNAVPDYFLEYKNGIKPIEVKNLPRLGESRIFQTKFYHAMSQLFRSDIDLKILVSKRKIGSVELFKEIERKRLLPPAIVNLGNLETIQNVVWEDRRFGNFIEQIELAWGIKWLAERGFMPEVEKNVWVCQRCRYRELCLKTPKSKVRSLEPMKPFHVSYAVEINERMGEELETFLGKRDCDSVRRWVVRKFGDSHNIGHYVLEPLSSYEREHSFDKKVQRPKIIFSAIPKEWKNLPEESIHRATLRQLRHVNLEKKIKTAKNLFK